MTDESETACDGPVYPGSDGAWPVLMAFERLDERAVRRLGGLLALKLQPGDVVTLTGDLGAGKTTLARAVIRSLLDDTDAEVPSPTFPLVVEYRAPRLDLFHYDFYRISDSSEVYELGLDDAMREGVALIEWPDRAGPVLPAERIDIEIRAPGGGETRDVILAARGAAASRIARVGIMAGFLTTAAVATEWGDSAIGYLHGDASPRAYARLTSGASGHSAILMDAPRMPDGPPVRDGLAYSRIAHLAEDVGPFIRIARHLAAADLSVPAILASDLDRGLLLIEDLGDLTFARALAAGESQRELWGAALAPLTRLHGEAPPPDLPVYDSRALSIELELVLDWMWPAIRGEPASPDVRRAFREAWQPLIARVADRRDGIVLRDYHSPNLMWLPDRIGHRRVGILDFQDAVAGPAAYDVVSLIQDARLDVAADLERALLDAHVADLVADGRLADATAFRADYAILGAQRATKILGIFVRLSHRDGKHAYLAHLPRISGYLDRNLAHPDLADVRRWYDEHLPAPIRAALAPPVPDRTTA